MNTDGKGTTRDRRLATRGGGKRGEGRELSVQSAKFKAREGEEAGKLSIVSPEAGRMAQAETEYSRALGFSTRLEASRISRPTMAPSAA